MECYYTLKNCKNPFIKIDNLLSVCKTLTYFSSSKGKNNK